MVAVGHSGAGGSILCCAVHSEFEGLDGSTKYGGWGGCCWYGRETARSQLVPDDADGRTAGFRLGVVVDLGGSEHESSGAASSAA